MGVFMTGQAGSLSRHDLEAKIVKRCWEDEGFRREFAADPAGAFVKYLEVPAASVPRIFVHQEERGSWHIVLPAKPPGTNELSEADLEKVAGATSLSFALVGIDDILGIPMRAVRAMTAAGATALTVSGGVMASAIVSAKKGW
jgi:hypothetical protein